MPAERLSMRNVREVLRLKGLGLSLGQITASTGVPRTTAHSYLLRARAAGIGWPLPEDLDDAALERLLFGSADPRPGRPLPNWASVHTELRRKGVTLALLWEEYKLEHSDGYQYSQFCDHYRAWTRKLHVSMRQEHRGGEKLFVDYSGDGIPWIDPGTGRIEQAQLFVAVIGASSKTYAEATRTQKLRDWITAHVHTFEYFGGVVDLVVPDQTRTAVKEYCRYEPGLNTTYSELARHYGTCLLPARPRKPRDKAKVEVGVLLVQRWIIARLRNTLFQSIDEINEAIGGLLEKLNAKPMRKLRRSREDLFLELDKPALKPLPERPYEYAEWKLKARINIDYHVEFEKNFYSAPFQHAREEVDLRATVNTVEVFLRSRRIASHPRLYGKFLYSTTREHMPLAHQAHLDWTPSRILGWAKRVGPRTAELIERILEDRPHPEQGYRSTLGILRLSREYSEARLEKACERAVMSRNYSYRAIRSILKNHLENEPLPTAPPGPLPHHENLRGASYFN
jgi:transposase